MIRRGLDQDLRTIQADINESGSYSDFINIFDIKDTYAKGIHTITMRGSDELQKGTYIYVEIADEAGRPIPIQVAPSSEVYEQEFLPLRRFSFEVTDETLNGVATITFVATLDDGRVIKYERKFSINKSLPSKPVIYRGDWAEGEFYDTNEVVGYNGSSYISILSHKSIENADPTIDNSPPDSTYWRVFADRGNDGLGVQLSISSSNGVFFKNGTVSTTLSGNLILNGESVVEDGYQWIKNGTPISGETGSTLAVSETTSYVKYELEVTHDNKTYKSEIDLYGYEDGVDAQLIKITSDSQIIELLSDGAPVNETITLDVLKQNYTGGVEWFKNAEDTPFFTGDTPPAITVSDFNGEKSLKITAQDTEDGSLRDEITLFIIREGSDAITIIVENENHTFGANRFGVVNSAEYSEGVTDVKVYLGNTLLTYNNTVGATTTDLTVGQYLLTVSSNTNIVGTPSKVSGNAVITPSEFADGKDSAFINFTIDVRTSDTDVRTFTKQLSYSKSLAPEKAKFIDLLPNDGQIFEEDQDGQVTTPRNDNKLTFSVERSTTDIEGDPIWKLDGTQLTAFDGLYDATLIASNVESGVKVLSVEINGTSFIDKVSIARLKEGKDTFTILLSNEFHGLPSDRDGTVSSVAGAETSINIYRGITDVTGNFEYSVPNEVDVNYTYDPPISANGYTLKVNTVTDDVTSIPITATPKTAFADFYPTSLTKTFTLTKVRQGELGLRGLSLLYKGQYESGVTYSRTDVSTDVVIWNGTYYYVPEGVTSINTDDPTGTNTDWVQFEAQFESVATDLLLAKDVTIRRSLTMGEATNNSGGTAESGGIIQSLGGFDVDGDSTIDPALFDTFDITIDGTVETIDKRFYTLDWRGIYAWRGVIGGWNIEEGILKSVVDSSGMVLDSVERSIKMLSNGRTNNPLTMAEDAVIPTTVPQIGTTVNGVNISTYTGGGTVSSDPFAINTPNEGVEVGFDFSAGTNGGVIDSKSCALQGRTSPTASWETLSEINFGQSQRNYISANAGNYTEGRLLFTFEVSGTPSGNTVTIDITTIRSKQYETVTVLNRNGLTIRNSPHSVLRFGGGSATVEFQQSTTETVSWNNVLGKPFVMLGNGLGTTNGALHLDFTEFSTSDISEGTNEYYTNEKVDDRVSSIIKNGTGISWAYDDPANTLTPTVTLSPFSTADLSEDTNLYHTVQRVKDVVRGTGVFQTLSTTDNVTFNNATFNGDVIIQGDTIQVDSQITTSDAVIDVNDGEAGAGVTLGFAGLNIDRGTENDYWFGFDEVRNRFTVGQITGLNATEIATTQVVATREDSPTTNGVAFWDDTNNRFSTASGMTWDGTTLSATNFSGVGTLLTSLNATELESGTVHSDRVTGVYSGITGVATLNVGAISSGFGNIDIGTSSLSAGTGTIADGAGTRLDVGSPSDASPTMLIGRKSGNPSIKSTESWLILEGGGTNGNIGVNYYSSGDVILANGGGKVGINEISPTKTLHVNGTSLFTGDSEYSTQITSTDGFKSGFGGNGVRIDFLNDDIHTTDLTVRGRMSVYELLIKQIRATNGSLWVSSSMKAEKVTTVTAGRTYNLHAKDDQFVTFTEGSVIRAQRFDGKGTYIVNGIVTNVVNGDPDVTVNTENDRYATVDLFEENLVDERDPQRAEPLQLSTAFLSEGSVSVEYVGSDKVIKYSNIVFDSGYPRGYLQYNGSTYFPTFPANQPVYYGFWARHTGTAGNITLYSKLDSNSKQQQTHTLTSGWKYFSGVFNQATDVNRFYFRLHVSCEVKGLTISRELSPDVPLADMDFVRIGHAFNSDEMGNVYLSADDSGAPFMDIIDEVVSNSDFQSAKTHKSRFGNLEGIVDPTFGQLEGYGSYIQNLYATGNAQIAGTLTAGDENGVGNTFYAGRIRKNLHPNSDNFANVSGTNKVYNDTTDPNGEPLATTYTTNNDNNQTFNANSFTGWEAGKTYTTSWWIKNISGAVETLKCNIYGGDFTIHTDRYTPFDNLPVGEWVRISFTFTINDPVGFAHSIMRADNTCKFGVWGLQVEEGWVTTSYQPTDGTVLSSDNGYGMWATRGGFGGTMQNPRVALQEEGIIVRNSGGNSGWGENDTISIGYSGTTWGIIGKKDSQAIFELGSSNQIAGWGFTVSQLSSVNDNIKLLSADDGRIEVGTGASPDYWDGDKSFMFGGTNGISYDGTNKIILGSDTIVSGGTLSIQSFANTTYNNLWYETDWYETSDLDTIVGNHFSAYSHIIDPSVEREKTPYGYNDHLVRLNWASGNSWISGVESPDVTIATDKTYKITFWFKPQGRSGRLYIGQDGGAVNGGNTNFYFQNEDIWDYDDDTQNPNEWYLFVGYILGATAPTLVNNESGVYRANGDTIFRSVSNPRMDAVNDASLRIGWYRTDGYGEDATASDDEHIYVYDMQIHETDDGLNVNSIKSAPTVRDLTEGSTVISGNYVKTGILESNNYTSPTTGSSPFSVDGTQFNLNTGELLSKNFVIDSNGSLELKGKVIADSGFIGGWEITNDYLKSEVTGVGRIKLDPSEAINASTNVPSFRMGAYFSSIIGDNGIYEILNISPQGVAPPVKKYNEGVVTLANYNIDCNGSFTVISEGIPKTFADSLPITESGSYLSWNYKIGLASADTQYIKQIKVYILGNSTSGTSPKIIQTIIYDNPSSDITDVISGFSSYRDNHRLYIEITKTAYGAPAGTVSFYDFTWEETNTTILINEKGIFRRIGTNVVESIGGGGEVNTTVASVNGYTGDVTLDHTDVDAVSKASGGTFDGNVSIGSTYYLQLQDATNTGHRFEQANDGTDGLVLRTLTNGDEIFQVRSSGQAVRFAVHHGVAPLVGGSSGWEINGNAVYHEGNDGSGSGLDADLLDGNHASAFATGDNFSTTGNYSGLRAQATTAGDVGLGTTDNVEFINGTFTGDSFTQNNRFTKTLANRANSVDQSISEVRIPWSSTSSGWITLEVEVMVETNSVGTRGYVKKKFLVSSYSPLSSGEIYSQVGWVTESTSGGGHFTISDIIEDSANGELVIEVYCDSDRSYTLELTAWGNNAIASQILNATLSENVQTDVAYQSLQPASVQNDFYTPDSLYIGGEIKPIGSDTNTYIQFHSGDQWRVVTGGSERLEVNNTAVTVQNQLQVNGSITGNAITANNTGDGAVLLNLETERSWRFLQRNTGGLTRLALQSTTGNKEFDIEDDTGEAVFTVGARTDSGRGVTVDGFGTFSGDLTAEGTLDVSGKATVNSLVISQPLSPSSDDTPLGNVVQADSQILFYANDTDNWAGIGTDTGGHVWVRTGIGSSAMFRFSRNGHLNLYKGDFRIGNTTVIDSSRNFTGVNADFSGNVGIGTTTPNYKLDVSGSAHFNTLKVSDGVIYDYINGTSETGTYKIITGGGTDTGWKKVFTLKDTSGTSYRGVNIEGYIKSSTSNHYDTHKDIYKWSVYVNFTSNGTVVDGASLRLSKNCPDVIRLIKVGTNDYELQIRQDSSYDKVHLEANVMANRGSDFAYHSNLPTATSGTVVTPNYTVEINFGRVYSTELISDSIVSNGDLTVSGDVDLARTSYLTFYGDENEKHAIGSRNKSGTHSDDIRINSYGAVYVNLDSNSNNGDGTANFEVGYRGGTGAIGTTYFTVESGTGDATFTGNVLLDDSHITLGFGHTTSLATNRYEITKFQTEYTHSTNTPKISFLNYNTSGTGWYETTGRYKAGISLYTVSANSQIEAMTITDVGDLGIGTTSPDYKLDVDGDVGVRNNFWALGNAFVQGKLRFRENWSSDDITANAIYNNENNRGFAFGNGSSLSTWFSYTSTNGVNRMIDAYNDGSKVVIHPNVGIGTTSPSAKLDVSGNTELNGTLDVSGDATFGGGTLTITSQRFEQFPLNITGGGSSLAEWRVTMPDSSIWVRLGKLSSTSNDFWFGGTATDNEVTLWNFRNAPVNLNGVSLQSSGTTVIDSSRNFTGVNADFSGTLDVSGDATVGGTLQIQNSDIQIYHTYETFGDYLNFKVSDGNNYGSYKFYSERRDVPSNRLIAHFDGDLNTWVFPNSGTDVGIGTDSPSAKLDVVGNTELNGTLDVSGISTLETAQIGTLRTTLFKPNSINGMGGEFAFTAVSKVVSIDADADTIVIKDPVFSENDLLIVSSGLYDDAGFVRIKLEVDSSGSSVAGGTQYKYIVRNGYSLADEAIEAGFTAIRAGNNGAGTSTDLIYVDATEGGDSPSIKAYDGIDSFADSPLDGGSATPVWELTATGGVVGGANFDVDSLWGGGTSKATSTIKLDFDAQKVRIGDNDTQKSNITGAGIYGETWYIDSTNWVHPSLGTLVASGRSEASSTANDDAEDISNLYFHEQSTVSFGSKNNQSTKIRSGFVKRSGENTLRIVGRHLIDFNYGSNNGDTDIICRASVFIHDENGATGVGGGYDNWVEFGRTSNYNSEGNFSFTVDISTLTNDRVYTVEFDMRAQVSHSGSNSSTINFKVQKNVAIRTITD